MINFASLIEVRSQLYDIRPAKDSWIGRLQAGLDSLSGVSRQGVYMFVVGYSIISDLRQMEVTI